MRTTIGGTLASVRNGKDESVEYIVIDGGSTDGTVDIIQENVDVVDVYVSERDSGISDAFNRGIARATGEWIGIVSGDDILLPGVVGKIRAASTRHPDADVFYGDVIALDGNQAIANPVSDDFFHKPWRLTLRHAGIWVRSSGYERVGVYATDRRYAMDYEWCLRALKCGARFQYVHGFLGAYRTGGLSSPRSNSNH